MNKAIFKFLYGLEINKKKKIILIIILINIANFPLILFEKYNIKSIIFIMVNINKYNEKKIDIKLRISLLEKIKKRPKIISIKLRIIVFKIVLSLFIIVNNVIRIFLIINIDPSINIIIVGIEFPFNNIKIPMMI